MDRPRRSTRQPVRLQAAQPENKRKATATSPDDKFLKTLLESPKSDLVSINLNDIINNNTWSLLSPAHRTHLKSLMPPIDSPSPFFTDPYFLSACRTFQDHLYLGWFAPAHLDRVLQFQRGIVDGSLAAPWKDVVWERDREVEAPAVALTASGSRGLAGGAAEVKLSTLAKNNIIRVGDVIAYRRAFASSQVIEKDAIVQSIHPNTYAITVLTVPGPTKDLPHSLLCPSSQPTSTPSQTPLLLSTTITSPTTLETALLDTDARVPRARRPNGNAWKCCSVWRWPAGGGEDKYIPYDSRGGRENHGTLFYLRACFFSDER